METLTPTPQYLKEKQVYLIKEGRCFSCHKKRHTIYNYPKIRKIATIVENVSKNSNSEKKE